MNVPFAYRVTMDTTQLFQIICKTYRESIRGFSYSLPEKNGEHSVHMHITKGLPDLNQVPTFQGGRSVIDIRGTSRVVSCRIKCGLLFLPFLDLLYSKWRKIVPLKSFIFL
jgi:hypothetical protein